MVTYKNPWHDPKTNLYGPAQYETNAEPHLYRGFAIYQRVPGVWDVVFGSTCLTQRAGLRGAKGIIDQYLDGPQDFFTERMRSYLVDQCAQ